MLNILPNRSLGIRRQDLTSKIVFRDETTVCSPGEVDQSISRIRIGNDRRELISRSSNEPKFSVFRTLTERDVFGPYFIR